MSSRRNRGGAGGGHGGGGEERWLLPYADMITLLLGLFIVLFAMSTINAKQFDQVRRSLAQTFSGNSAMNGSNDVLPGSNGVMDPTSPSMGQVDDPTISMEQASSTSQQQFEAEAQKLKQLQQQLGLGKDVNVTRTEIGIQISIAGDALFPSGSYQLSTPGIKDELKKIEAELEKFGRPIRIEGHTDGAPMSATFGNYELGAMRALAVQKFFADHGYSHSKMYTVSFGPDRPKVKPPSPTADFAPNRRIEIVVLEPSAEDAVPNVSDRDRAVARNLGLERRHARTPTEAEVNAHLDQEFGEVTDSALIDELAAAGQGAP